ncbi:unnamed protein product [Blepharisma stoltei]|uniref:Uncharacterized protein n=1 Tax=Blepharisma stoltei TaxID=1481888 RepID=A0AAU9IS70_9CILI|nr:unnamed protein product [Blepharisma stoltei]
MENPSVSSLKKLWKIKKIGEKWETCNCSTLPNKDSRADCFAAKKASKSYKNKVKGIQNQADWCYQEVERGPYLRSSMVSYTICMRKVEKSFENLVLEFYPKFLKFDNS